MSDHPPVVLPPVDAVDVIPEEKLAAFVIELSALTARAAARLAARPPTASPASECLLTADEVAERLKLSRDVVYRHATRWPFTRRVGRAVRFSSTGLDRWLARQG